MVNNNDNNSNDFTREDEIMNAIKQSMPLDFMLSNGKEKLSDDQVLEQYYTLFGHGAYDEEQNEEKPRRSR